MTEAYARNADPQSSKDAAEIITTTSLEDRVYQVLLKAGCWMTCHEVAFAAGLDKWSVSPRFQPLLRKGLIEAGKKVSISSIGKPRELQAWRAVREPPKPAQLKMELI